MRNKRRAINKLVRLLKEDSTPRPWPYEPKTPIQLWAISDRVLVRWEAKPRKYEFKHLIISEFVHKNTQGDSIWGAYDREAGSTFIFNTKQCVKIGVIR